MLRGGGKNRGGEGVLPDPLFVGGGVFFFEGVGQVDRAESGIEVLLVKRFYFLEVLLEGGYDTLGEHGDTVVAAFAVVDDEGLVAEVEVFDAEAQAFHEAQSGAVHDLDHEFVGSCEVADDGAGFCGGEDDGDAFSFFGAGEAEGLFVQFFVEDVAVEEEDGAEGLVLG